MNNPPRTGKKLFYFLLLLATITILSTGNAEADIYTPDFYFDFEDLPAATTCSLMNSSYCLTLTVPFDMITSQRKLGSWAVTLQDYAVDYLYANTLNLTSGGNVSYSFWIKPDLLTTQLKIIFEDLYQAGGFRGFQGYISATSNNFCFRNYYDGSNAVTWCKPLINNTWQQVVITAEYTTADSKYYPSDILVYINGNSSGATSPITNKWGGYYYSNTTQLLIAESASTHTWNPHNFLIDEFARYSEVLTQADVNSLYNDGNGFNPLSASAPTQSASIAPIYLNYSSQRTLNLNDYWLGGTNYSINFAADSASWETYYPLSAANPSDFAVYFDTLDTARIFSFLTDVSAQVLNICAHNAYGDSCTLTYLYVGDYEDVSPDTTITPTQVASIAGFTLTEGTAVTRRFSDYFYNFASATWFYAYIHPTTGVYTTVAQGATASVGGCFNVSISGYVLTFTGLNLTCSDGVVSWFVGMDNSSDPQTDSNSFLIKNYASGEGGTVADISGADPDSLSGKLLGMFPNPDSTSATTKLFIVVIAFLIVLVSGAYMTYAGSTALGGVAAGIGAIILLIFFTVIGYIPLWMIALIILGGVVIGVGSFRRMTMGEV